MEPESLRDAVRVAADRKRRRQVEEKDNKVPKIKMVWDHSGRFV